MNKITIFLLNLVFFTAFSAEVTFLSEGEAFLPYIHNLGILVSEYCSQFGKVKFFADQTEFSKLDCKAEFHSDTLRQICYDLFNKNKRYFTDIRSSKEFNEKLDDQILFEQFFTDNFLVERIHAVSFNSTVSKKVILRLIENEKESIDISVFKLTDYAIISALKKAAQNGVRVRIILNKSSTKNKYDFYTFENFDVKYYESHDNEILHHKYVIFGRNIKNKSILINGSANLSTAKDLQEDTLFTEDIDLLSAFKKNFQQLIEGIDSGQFKFSNNSKFANQLHKQCLFDSSLVKFALIRLIQNEKRSIRIATMYLSDFDIIREIRAAKRRGVSVCVIASKLQFKIVDHELNTLHNKYAIFDCTLGGKKLLCTGSCNFSKAAFSNLENVLILEDPKLVAEYEKNFTALKWMSIARTSPSFN